MLLHRIGLLLGLCLAGSLQATAAPVDVCKMIDPAAISAAAKAWFGITAPLAQSSAPGPRGSTCDYTTDTPVHIDISIFYVSAGNPEMLGLGQPTPLNETPVPGVGDRAVSDQDASPANRYKSQNLAILRGKAILVLNLTLDQKLAFVTKKKLADFAVKQLVPKM